MFFGDQWQILQTYIKYNDAKTETPIWLLDI